MATVKIYVRDLNTGLVIEGATVVLNATTSKTDANGYCAFGGIPYDSPIVTVSKTGYTTKTETFFVDAPTVSHYILLEQEVPPAERIAYKSDVQLLGEAILGWITGTSDEAKLAFLRDLGLYGDPKFTNVTDTLAFVHARLRDQFDERCTLIDRGITGVGEQVVKVAADAAGKVLEGIGTTLGELIGKGSVVSPEGARGSVETIVTEGAVGAVAGVDETVNESLEKAFYETQGYALTWDAISAGIIAATAAVSAIPFTSIGDAIDESWRTPVISGNIFAASDFYSAWYQFGIRPKLQRYYNAKYLSLLPETYRLAMQAAKGLITDGVYKAAMAQSGLSAMWADVWRQEQWVYPTVETALVLLRRGELTTSEFDTWMTKQAIPEDARLKIQTLKDVIPPLDDLIRFAVREAFGAHTMEEQYPAYEYFAGKMGLSPERASWYWYAHWERIPVEQMYDNLRRGLWDKAKFMRMLHIKDLHPDDREDIYNVAYGPPSIREMGYGFDVGAYTEEDIVRYRRWGGLSPEDAAKAGTAMVAYRTEAEREAVRRAHMYLVTMEKETLDDFTDNLVRLGTNPHAIPLWIERAQLETEKRRKEAALPEQRITSASEALFAFEWDLKPEAWTRQALGDLGWTQERIDLAIQRSMMEKAQRKAKEAPPPPRMLTLTQIRDLFRLGMLTAEQVFPKIFALGYDVVTAGMLMQIIVQETAAERAPRLLSIAQVEELYDFGVYSIGDVYDHYIDMNYSVEDAIDLTFGTIISERLPYIRSWYSKGWLTTEGVMNELLATGLPVDRAEEIAMTLIKAYAPERTAPERDLTKAEILKARMIDMITTTQYVELMESIGYDEWESRFILQMTRMAKAGDPDGYWDLRRVVELSKKARGEPSIEVPEELIKLESELKAARDELKKLKAQGASEEQIGEVAAKIAALEAEIIRLAKSYKLL